jgi:hypothetical protein
VASGASAHVRLEYHRASVLGALLRMLVRKP